MISLIIPHMPFPEADQALEECLNSMHGQDETLVIVNNGIGYGAAVNIGLKLSRGDYLIVANNDVILLSGDLSELPDKRGVTIPMIHPTAKDEFPRSFFCIPKWIYEKVGGYDERFTIGYWEDDDLIMRLKNLHIPVLVKGSVKIHHKDGGGLTMKKMGEQENWNKNRDVFIDKWGTDSIY